MGSRIQNTINVNSSLAANALHRARSVAKPISAVSSAGNVSFQGASQLSKQGWFLLRKLSHNMKNVTEMTNAYIAAIGTGIIAPFVILASPGKGDKEDKDKKKFQALRQPLSAALALIFQAPATYAINNGIDYLAYKKKIKAFSEKGFGNLIPDIKYLKKHVNSEEITQWDAMFDQVINGTSLKQELENRIIKEYREVGLTVSPEKLAKRVAKERKSFLMEKIANAKHAELVEAKINELRKLKPVIKDTDLVTESYKQLAIQRNNAAYNEIEKNIGLTLKDKIARLMGFSTKKLKELEVKQNEFATEKGLEILKKSNRQVFKKSYARLKQYIENQEVVSQKMFSNKKFWISLLVNLFMVTASCYALNWAHPRLKEVWDKYKNKNAQQNNELKVEVK